YVERIVFSSDFDVVKKLIAQTAEFQSILQSPDAFPTQNFLDVTDSLENTRIIGSVLDEKSIFDIKSSLSAISKCLSFISNIEPITYPELKELAMPIHIDKNLLKNIDRIIADSGKIRDNASKELQNIRADLYSEQSGLRKKLDSLLRSAKADGFAPDDVSLTIRNGRMVIPIFAENKRKVKGFIHDESATGQTVFIEPVEVFDSNNRIRELENDERREIIRILAALTDEIRQHLPELKKAYRFLGVIDFIQAKAKLAQNIKASKQFLQKSVNLSWTRTFHPLLYLANNEQHKAIVPLSIKLETLKRVLVISGPNAGGKSVVLKTIGLLQYMNQCGLLVPNGEQCTFGVFKDIFIDIGDEQSIENDLSTYSSHITNMREIINNAGKNALVLIDEFGTGTDPQYGGAIAESILEEIVKNESFAVVNTHYSNLKFYAENTQGVVNGAMKYNYEQLTPLYELEIGKPGNSFALEIAQKIGLPQNVLNRAKNKIGDKRISVDKLVKELQTEKQQFQKKNDDIQKAKSNLEETVKQYSELKEFLERTKAETLQNAKIEAKRIVQEAKLESQVIIKQLKETKNYSQIDAEVARAELREIEKKVGPKENIAQNKPKIDDKPIKIGDKVSIDGGEANFKVSAIKGNEVELSVGEMKTMVKLSRLRKTSGEKIIEQSQPAFKRVQGIDINERMNNFSPTIDLRGRRGEEAIGLVDNFLDNALLLGSYQLRILHGKGDGILRKLIREHLRNVSFVATFKDEKVEFGGDGITLVDLK
ncbi:MAG: endonuclease MutS2, partial [Cytophagales bacterium]